MNPNEVSDEYRASLEGEEEEEYLEQDAHGKRRKRKPVPPRTKTRVSDIEKLGDLEALKGVERVMDMRWRAIGLGQTRNVNINWRKQAESEGLDPEQVIAKLTEGFIKEAEKKS